MKIKKNSLALRHLTAIVLVSLFFSVGAIYYQGRLRYYHALEAHEEVLDIIRESYVPSVASGVFFFDRSQLQLLARGIALLPYIESVVIMEKSRGENNVITSAGIENNSKEQIHLYPLIYDYEGEAREIGLLQVSTSLEQLYKSFSQDLWIIAITNLFKIFGFTIIVIIVIQGMVFRHLGFISEFFKKLNPNYINDQKLVLPRSKIFKQGSDELDDITNAINDMLKRSELILNEKERLIHELYHRTNNNMQVIQSLLIYNMMNHPEISLDDYVDIVNRQIQSMALAQQELYRSGHLSKLDLRQYLILITEYTLSFYKDKKEKVSVSYELESIGILLDTAIPMGTIVSELLIDLLNHSFEEESSSKPPLEITVRSSVSKAGEIETGISFNKVRNYPEAGSPYYFTGGIGLAVSLVEKQLGGKIFFDNEKERSNCKICFYDNRYTERV